MTFKRFIEEGKVRKAKLDLQLVKSLIKTSEKHTKVAKMLEINNITKETVFVMYYEVLRELIEAMAMKDGYKVYSHEAFTFYLREKYNEVAANKFDRYRKLRNGVNYYGKEIPVDDVKMSVKEIKKLINEIKDKYLKDAQEGI